MGGMGVTGGIMTVADIVTMIAATEEGIVVGMVGGTTIGTGGMMIGGTEYVLLVRW